MCLISVVREWRWAGAWPLSFCPPVVCQFLRLCRRASEDGPGSPGWLQFGEVGSIVIIFFFFLLKLDFIFGHSETSTLSWNPVLALNFHLTMQELEWYKDVRWRWRRQSEMVRRRARQWQKMETARYRRERVRRGADKVAAYRFQHFQISYDSFYTCGEANYVAITLQ